MFTADEGDHFAGTVPSNPGCDGVTTPCAYPANGVGEQTALINDALTREKADASPFTIHFDDNPNFYVGAPAGSTAPPGRLTRRPRQLEHDLGGLTLTNQVTGSTDQVTTHIATAEEQRILHMTTTDPLRTPTFTDFANPTYLYQTGNCPAGKTPGCPIVNLSFAWNHGGDEPEVTATWLGMVGATIKRLGQTNSIWTDHTDIRPTMLATLGLGSDYEQDGRAVTELMTSDTLPWSLALHLKGFEHLSDVYKQLDAAVGQFGHDSEIVSTSAAESVSPGDAVAKGFDAQLTTCQRKRDQLAGEIKSQLNEAIFGHGKFDGTALRLIRHAQRLIDEMYTLSKLRTPPARIGCD